MRIIAEKDLRKIAGGADDKKEKPTKEPINVQAVKDSQGGYKSVGQPINLGRGVKVEPQIIVDNHAKPRGAGVGASWDF